MSKRFVQEAAYILHLEKNIPKEVQQQSIKKRYLKLFWTLQLSSPFLQRFKMTSFCKAEFPKLVKGQWSSLYFSKCQKKQSKLLTFQTYNLKVKAYSLVPFLLLPSLSPPFDRFLSSSVHYLAAAARSNTKFHTAQAELQPGIFWRPSQFKMFFWLLFFNHKQKLKMFVRLLFLLSPPGNIFFGHGPLVLSST